MLQDTRSTQDDTPTALRTADEWQAYADTLLDEIRTIEGQLSDTNRSTPTGGRLDNRAYWEWRSRARFAWQAKMAQYRAAKTQARTLQRQATHRQRMTLDGVVPTNRQLLGRLFYDVVRVWLRTGRVAPSPEEQAIITAVAENLDEPLETPTDADDRTEP